MGLKCIWSLKQEGIMMEIVSGIYDIVSENVSLFIGAIRTSP